MGLPFPKTGLAMLEVLGSASAQSLPKAALSAIPEPPKFGFDCSRFTGSVPLFAEIRTDV